MSKYESNISDRKSIEEQLKQGDPTVGNVFSDDPFAKLDEDQLAEFEKAVQETHEEREMILWGKRQVELISESIDEQQIEKILELIFSKQLPDKFFILEEVFVVLKDKILEFLYIGRIPSFFDKIPLVILKSEEISGAMDQFLLVKFGQNNYYDLENVLIFFKKYKPSLSIECEQALEGCLKEMICYSIDRERVLKIIKIFSVSGESIKRIIKAGLIFQLEKLNFDGIKNIITDFSFEKSILGDSEILEKAQDKYKEILKNEYFSYEDEEKLKSIRSWFHFPSGFFVDPEVQQLARKKIRSLVSKDKNLDVEKEVALYSISKDDFYSDLASVIVNESYGFINNIKKYIKIYSISEDVQEKFICLVIVGKLEKGYLVNAKEIKTFFSISDEVAFSPESKSHAISGFINCLPYQIGKSKEIIELYNFSKEEVQNLLQEYIINRFSDIGSGLVLELVKNFYISESFLLSQEFQNIALKVLFIELNTTYIQETEVKEMINFFKLPDDKVKIVAQRSIVQRSGDLRSVEIIAKMFSIPTDFLSSPDVIESVKKDIAKFFIDGNSFEMVENVAKFYSISKEDIYVIAAEVIVQWLEEDHISWIFKICESVKEVAILDFPKVSMAIKSSFARYIDRGDFNVVFYCINVFPIPDSVFSSRVVLNAVKNSLTKVLSCNIQQAVDLLLVFPLVAKSLSANNVVEALRGSLCKSPFFTNGSVESILNFIDKFSVPDFLVVEESSNFLISNFDNGDKINTFLSNSLPEKYHHDVLVKFLSRIMLEGRHSTKVDFTSKDSIKDFFNQKFPGLVDDDLLFESGMQVVVELGTLRERELREKICGTLNISEDHILDFSLANKNFNSFQDIDISDDKLDDYFSDNKNCTFVEYARIYTVFRPYDYYCRLLNKISSGDIKIRLAILTVMGENEINNDEHYLWVKDQVLLIGNNLSTPISKMLGESLGRFIKAGDTDLLPYCLDIIRDKIKNVSDESSDIGAFGLSSLQELALRTLLNSGSNSEINEICSLIMNGDLSPRVKLYILKKVLVGSSGYFSENYLSYITEELARLKDKFNWEDLRFMSATRSIPSLDIKQKIIDQSDKVFENKKINLSVLGKKFPNIPDESMLAVCSVVGDNEDSMYKINILYSKMNTLQRNSLLFDFAHLNVVPIKIRDFIFSFLPTSDFKPEDIIEVEKLFRNIVFLYQNKGFFNADNDHLDKLVVSSLNIFDLNKSLEQSIVDNIKKLLPHHKINSGSVIHLMELWGSIDPICVYAQKMNSHLDVKRYLAEVVSHIADGSWQEWRYDLNRKNVQKQVGDLDEKQLINWQEEIFVETNDIVLLSTPSDKPQQLAGWLSGAVQEGHLDEGGKNMKFSFIQQTFLKIIQESETDTTKRQELINSKISELKEDMSLFDILILNNDIKKLEDIILQFSSSKIAINSKLKNSISFLVRFLSKEDQEEVLKKYKQVDEGSEFVEKDGQKKVTPSQILSDVHLLSIKKVINDIKNKKNELINSNKLVKYGFNSDTDIDLKKLFSKRNEIKIIYDLCRLSVIDVKNIVFNSMEKNIGKKGGEEMNAVINNLLNYFKDCPSFVQDLENIKLLVEKNDAVVSSKKRKLALILTDDPQMLFQLGKYPTGCGSCQNYEGSPELNRSLVGYVGDAHIKVSYLIDLNKLPELYIDEIERNGFEAVKNKIPKQFLLEASLARSVLKLVNLKDIGPAIFIEPIYTSLNKADKSQDNLFEQTVLYSMAKPMGIPVVRGGGEDIALVPASSNPQGQYEDCATGNAGHGGMGIKRGAYAMSARLV